MGRFRGISALFSFLKQKITFNLCLGEQFEGGELFIGERIDQVKPDKQASFECIPHSVGTAVIHLGTQLHGAMPVSSGGRRVNLILWCKSSKYRAFNGCQFCGKSNCIRCMT